MRHGALAGVVCVLSLSGPWAAYCQSYDSSAPSSQWKIDGGLQASCPSQNYPTSGWDGQTRITHSRDDSGDVTIQIRVTVSVLVQNGFSNSRLSADSLFTFRFSEADYNSYESVGWLWSPADASTLVKASDGNGDFLIVQTRVQVNIQTFQIRLFEIVDIVANSCPGSNSCYGNACGSAACSDLNCPAVTAQAAASASSAPSDSDGGSSSDHNAGSSNSGGSSDDSGSSGSSHQGSNSGDSGTGSGSSNEGSGSTGGSDNSGPYHGVTVQPSSGGYKSGASGPPTG